jgi:hypothetical protein
MDNAVRLIRGGKHSHTSDNSQRTQVYANSPPKCLFERHRLSLTGRVCVLRNQQLQTLGGSDNALFDRPVAPCSSDVLIVPPGQFVLQVEQVRPHLLNGGP